MENLMNVGNPLFIAGQSNSNELVGLLLVLYWWEIEFYRYYQIIKCLKLEANESIFLI